MKAIQIVFSPTGGTQKVASAITQTWENVKSIDLSSPTADFSEVSIDKDSLVLIAMPSFGGLAPQFALDRLSKIKGNGARCAIVAVYGNRAFEDTLVQIEDTAKAAGFNIIAGIAAIAEHSIMRQFATGRPNEKDCEMLKEFGGQILAKATSGDGAEPEIPGNRPYKTTGDGMAPKANSKCTSCAKCAKACPAGAISLDNLRATDQTKCIHCMRCVAICPVHARSVSKLKTAIASSIIKKACSVEKSPELFI